MFSTVLKGKTSFVIAHRLSTIKNADRILYVDDNGILEDGSHEELMQNNEIYRDIYELHITGWFKRDSHFPAIVPFYEGNHLRTAQ